MVRLRGHHLICLFFFEGDVEEDAFELGRRRVLKQCESGEPIQIVQGADDLCASCRYLSYGHCALKPGADIEIARLDSAALEGIGISVGDSLSWRDAASRVIDMPGTWFSGFCHNCEWSAGCRMGALKTLKR